ncbi:MAG: NUDIX hydrolase [Parcubacteria group bacterium]|jgi:8-oxo-dGTP pyrophosphatase MutT (NUDIX family)
MKTNGPWKIIESHEKYKNNWMKVCEDKVIRPDGKEGIVSLVEMEDGISALSLDNDGYVYLADQFRYSTGKDGIETVSGAVNNNEKPLDTAKRELREELGIEAEEWIDLGLVNPFNVAIKAPHTIFLARKLKFGKDHQKGAKKIKLVKVKLEEAVKMVMNSIITNGPSCVLILKTNEYLKSPNSTKITSPENILSKK